MLAKFASYLGRHHVALLALFVALGGTSYAVAKLPKNSVGTKQLRKNAVISSKVKDRSLLARDFKKGQLPRGARGPTGSQGVPGPQGPKGDPTYKRTILVSPVGTPLQNGTALRNALASIKDAASDKQYLLKIEPGSYDIGTTALAMKSWVDVEGSGNSRTLILGEVDAGAYTTGMIVGAPGSELRWLYVGNTVPPGHLGIGIYAGAASRPFFSIERVQVSVSADIAIGVYEKGAALPIDGSSIFATANSGASHFAFAIDAEPDGPAAPFIGLTNSSLSAGGGATNVALQMTKGAGKVTNSQLQGGTAISLSYPGPTLGSDKLLVGTSEIDGTVSLTNGALLTCVYVYNANFTPLNSVCS